MRAMLDSSARRRSGLEPGPRLPTAGEILATAKPAILLHRSTLPVPLDHPARSYLGGLPRLPAELAWPEIEKYERFAMTFVAQIDLAELPEIEESPLPRKGTLYFFADTSDDCPEPGDCRVLYHPGDASTLPLRELPQNSQPYAIGDEPWPWLPESSVWARTGFRFSLEFTVFDSMRDYFVEEGPRGRPARNTKVSKELMAAEFARRWGTRDAPPQSPWTVFERESDEWPFVWAVIEHGARYIVHAARKAAARREAANSKPEFERLATVASTWIDRAAQMAPQSRCDEPTRRAFVKDWRAWVDDLEAACRKSTIYPGDLHHARADIATVACYVCSSMSATDVIPEAYRLALEQLNDVGANFPRHQMLGHGETVQFAPIQYAEGVLLLQLLGDRALGWNTNTGCAYQFWADPEAVRESDFDSVEMTLECD